MKHLTFIALFTLTIDICLAQTIDIEKEKLQGVSTIVEKSFNRGGVKRGVKSKYHLNSKGQVISSKHLYKLQRRFEFEYQYDSLGNQTHKIQLYSINVQDRIDTFLTHYEYDNQNRIIKKTESLPSGYSSTKSYSNFNKKDKPKRVLTYLSTASDTLTQILEYNDKGELTKIKYPTAQDSLWTAEIRGYNEQGDLNYSFMPDLVGKENEPLAIWVGNRYSPEERLEYTYDRKNRWTKRFMIYKGEKVLLQKRRFK